MADPAAPDANRLLAESERLSASVRAAESYRYVGWLIGMAAASALYLTSLGVAGNDEVNIVATSAVFLAVVAVLSVSLLPGARVAKRGFSTRWGMAVGAWGAVFGAVMAVGLPIFPGALWFWIPAGFISAVPLIVGARMEARA